MPTGRPGVLALVPIVVPPPPLFSCAPTLVPPLVTSRAERKKVNARLRKQRQRTKNSARAAAAKNMPRAESRELERARKVYRAESTAKQNHQARENAAGKTERYQRYRKLSDKCIRDEGRRCERLNDKINVNNEHIALLGTCPLQYSPQLSIDGTAYAQGSIIAQLVVLTPYVVVCMATSYCSRLARSSSRLCRLLPKVPCVLRELILGVYESVCPAHPRAEDAVRNLDAKEWDTIRLDKDHKVNLPQLEAPQCPSDVTANVEKWHAHDAPYQYSAVVAGEDTVCIDTDASRVGMAGVVGKLKSILASCDSAQLADEYASRVEAFDEDSMVIIVAGSYERYSKNPFPGAKSSGVFANTVHKVGSARQAPRGLHVYVRGCAEHAWPCSI